MGDVVALEGIQSRSQALTSRDAVAVIARIVPDVTGVDKVFDYLVPESLAQEICIGDRVRIPLHNRNVAGWVVALGDSSSQFSDVDESRLLRVVKILGKGPFADVVEVALWASHHWAGRLRAFFVAASPSTLVSALPGSRYTQTATRKKFEIDAQVVEAISQGGVSIVRRGPASGPRTIVLSVAHHGPTLVIIPTINRARLMAASLREYGLSVAVLPQDWANAAGGVDVVIGARSAIFASAPALKSIVVIDEHDDSLQEERSPSWHVRDVAIYRAAKIGIPCVLVSPTPSLRAVKQAKVRIFAPDSLSEQSQWPNIAVIDRRKDERWANSLLSSELIEQLRDHSRRIVCVLNVKGRAKLLACASCRELVRCDLCESSMALSSEKKLVCARCAYTRPSVCAKCGSGKLSVIKAGISRLREELAAAAGRKVQEVVEVATGTATEQDSELDQTKMLFIGTEAALHRVRDVDTVVFLDIDQELFAPRYRASEITLTLIVHAARLVSRSGRNGKVMIQTFSADHEMLRGVEAKNLAEYEKRELSRREMMGLPPFGALAELSGLGVEKVADILQKNVFMQVSASSQGNVLVKAPTWDQLADALSDSFLQIPQSKGMRVKTQVDPPRA